MNIRDLKLYLHLCHTCHFGMTAAAMHVSPPTLSRQIQRLEEYFGHPLFIRDNRHVKMTEIGEKVKQFAQQVIQQQQELFQEIEHSHTHLSGELALFCSVTAAYSHLPEIIDRFRTAYPFVDIKLSTGDAADSIKKIQTNEADIAISGHSQQLPIGIDFFKLDEVLMTMLVPKSHCRFSEKLQKKEPDWQHVPFILPKHGPSRSQIETWFKQQKIISPQIYATVSGHEAIVSMVALGCGVALLPKVVFENSPNHIRERIVEYNISPISPLNIGVCVQKKRLSEKIIAAFWTIAGKNE